jgi:hypothetical protein
LELIKEFKNKKVLLLPKDKLDTILNSCEILIERDTVINDKVRVLKLDKIFLFQETTNKDEIALRKFTRIKDAETLVQDRLTVYENMWNGCGCKVNYYE